MDETALRIRFIGESVVRTRARAVTQVSQRHRDTLSKMAQVMYDAGGIGLAAPQVGISESMIVVDIGQGLYKLINPKIVKREGSQVREEGCLSVPGISINVKRAKRVLVEAQDDEGKKVKIAADNLLACVFQHEVDHLNGKLIVDYASVIEKLMLKKKIKEIKAKVKNGGSDGKNIL